MARKVDNEDNAALRPLLADPLSFEIGSTQRDTAQEFCELLFLGIHHVGDFDSVFGPNLLRLEMVPFDRRQAWHGFSSELHSLVVVNGDIEHYVLVRFEQGVFKH